MNLLGHIAFGLLAMFALVVIGFACVLIRGMKPPADATRIIHWRDR